MPHWTKQITTIEKDIKCAILLINRQGLVTFKFPLSLPDEKKFELRQKFLKIIEDERRLLNLSYFNHVRLKAYYKIGEPLLFLNSVRTRKTIATYEMDKI